MTRMFVSPAWLASARSGVTVVDVRPESAYASGHVAGAVGIPFERFRDPGDRTAGRLPTPEAFASLLSEAGIGPDDRLVAYDDDCGVSAARFLLTAEVFGHERDRLHLLDGDINVWRRDYGTTAAVPETRPTDYARRRPDGPLIDAEALAAAVDGDAVVVDTRDPLEYDAVHVPTAVNFQWRDLVNERTRRLEPPGKIERVLDDRGIDPGKPVRLYCNTARRLSFVYAVLRELGYDDVGVYEGGIEGWAEYGGPVETAAP